MWKLLLAFLVAQFINVVLSTIKSVFLIKGGKVTAAIMNAVAYAFNTIVIKFIGDVNIWIAVGVSVVCNLTGVYLGLWITEKLRKDQLWKITATVPTENFENLKLELKQNDINFISYSTNWNKYEVLDVFSKHKSESKVIREIFSKYNAKYTILANEGTL